jgi:hypothetical protein
VAQTAVVEGSTPPDGWTSPVLITSSSKYATLCMLLRTAPRSPVAHQVIYHIEGDVEHDDEAVIQVSANGRDFTTLKHIKDLDDDHSQKTVKYDLDRYVAKYFTLRFGVLKEFR